MNFSQKTRRGHFLFLLSFSLFLNTDAICQDNPANISPSPSSEIIDDGIQNEKAWSSIPPQTMEKDNSEFKYKIYYSDSYVHLLVVFPSGKEKRIHRLWHWDPVKQLYSSGPEKEDELYVLWSEFPLEATPDTFPDNADVWIWRAARTDPSGFADDYHLINNRLSAGSDNEFADLLQDNGMSCWTNTYFGPYAGNEIPRYKQRPPEGSLADVKAKGTWNSGIWTIEFSRKITSGNSDDIDFAGNQGLSVSFSLSPPKRKFLKLSSFKRVSATYMPPASSSGRSERLCELPVGE